MRKISIYLLFLVVGAAAFQFLNGNNASEEEKDMKAITAILKRQKIEHYLLTNPQGNQFLVVPQFGARILAVSVGGENLFWTHPDVLKGQGGQRSWISPEGGAKGFIFRPDWKGNRDFTMLDPGNYKVTAYRKNQHLALANSFKTTSNDGKENYDLTLTREMRFEEDPLKDDPEFKGQKYRYLGIDFVHKLKNNAPLALDRILSLWSLIQIPPKGTMVIPVMDVKQEAWRGNYFEPVPEEFVKANPDSFSFFIPGSQRYKAGIRPESATGIIGYFSKSSSGDGSLVLITFPVKPEGRYTDKPKVEQETNGDAIQIYSHLEPGNLAFGELECQSWGLDLPSGGEAAFQIKIYLYQGPQEALKKIGKKTVCLNFDKAYFF